MLSMLDAGVRVVHVVILLSRCFLASLAVFCVLLMYIYDNNLLVIRRRHGVRLAPRLLNNHASACQNL